MILHSRVDGTWLDPCDSNPSGMIQLEVEMAGIVVLQWASMAVQLSDPSKEAQLKGIGEETSGHIVCSDFFSKLLNITVFFVSLVL